MDYEKKYKDALSRARSMYESQDDAELAAYIFPELCESEDERIRKFLLDYAIEMIAGLGSDISRSTYDGIKGHDPDAEAELNQWQKARAYLEKQKEQKEIPLMNGDADLYFDNWKQERQGSPTKRECFNEGIKYAQMLQKEQKSIIQDVELNDAVYDYVRDHFIAGADFTPEYIKKLMENAFFAGVDYYLLKQESESCESDTNVEKVIEDVIRVYGKTQGEWVGGYDVDTLIVNLRRAFNKNEQKPVEPSGKLSRQDYLYQLLIDQLITYSDYEYLTRKKPTEIAPNQFDGITYGMQGHSTEKPWKPSEDEERLINTSISFLKDFADKGYENAVECIDWLKSKLSGNSGK